MIKPKCAICGLVLEGGGEEVTAEDLNFVMTGVDALNKDFGLPIGEEARKKQERTEYLKSVNAEEQTQYWTHNPKDLHRDIFVTAHKKCFDKVKAVYPNFDQPVQDYDTFKYKTIENNLIVEKTPKEYAKSTFLLYLKEYEKLLEAKKIEIKTAKDFELTEKQKDITSFEAKIAKITKEIK